MNLYSLERACSSLHHHIDMLQFEIEQRGSLLDALATAGRVGLFLHPETTEAITMANDVKALRRLASIIEASRAKLVGNVPADLMAAE